MHPKHFFWSTTKQKVTKNKFEKTCLKYGIYLFYLFSDSNLVTQNLNDHTRQKIVICCQVSKRWRNPEHSSKTNLQTKAKEKCQINHLNY